MSAGKMKSGGISLDTYARGKKAQRDKIVSVIDSATAPKKKAPAKSATQKKVEAGRERSQRRMP